MTAKLYVATAEPCHDNTRLVGIFSTLALAQAALPPCEWEADNDEETWTGKSADPLAFYETFEIKLLEVDAARNTPEEILSGGPFYR